jgi:hypothetical protein
VYYNNQFCVDDLLLVLAYDSMVLEGDAQPQSAAIGRLWAHWEHAAYGCMDSGL